MAELAELLELWTALGHVLEDFSARLQFAGFRARPAVMESLAYQQGFEALHAKGPSAISVADIDAILGVDRRHYGVAYGAPDVFIGEQRKNFLV